MVEADAVAQSRFTRRELRGHRGQLLLEELEDLRRGVLAGRCAALGGGLAGQPEYLCRDAVEEPRVALFVAALQGEGPGHQALLGGQGLPVRRGDERRELLGDRVLAHAEAGEERREALAALVRQLLPCAGVGGEVDGRRVPLLAGRDPGEEAGPEAAVRERLQPADELVLPQRGVGQRGTLGARTLLRIHGATVASARSGDSRAHRRAAFEQLDEALGVASADHPRLEARASEHRGQVLVDARGPQRTRARRRSFVRSDRRARATARTGRRPP